MPVNSRRGFTLMEMLVVVVVVIVLISISIAVAAQVLQTSHRKLTMLELHDLNDALLLLKHRNGEVPTTIVDFLQQYQRMYIFKDAGGVWHERSNLLTELPSSLTVPGQIPVPGGTMPGIVQVKDGYGNGILLLTSPLQNPHAPCFVSAGPDGYFNTADDLHSYDP